MDLGGSGEVVEGWLDWGFEGVVRGWVKSHKGVTSIFVVLEAFTGFTSLFVEPLVIPPLTSIGMILDLGIFATGLVAILYFSRQGAAKTHGLLKVIDEDEKDDDDWDDHRFQPCPLICIIILLLAKHLENNLEILGYRWYRLNIFVILKFQSPASLS